MREPLGRGIILLAGIVCSSMACSGNGFKNPETWQIVMWTDGGQRMGTLTVELTGGKALGAQYGAAEWAEAGQVVKRLTAGPQLDVPRVGSRVWWRRGASAEQFRVRIAADDGTGYAVVFYGRAHGSEAEGGFREDRELTSPLGRFEAHRL